MPRESSEEDKEEEEEEEDDEEAVGGSGWRGGDPCSMHCMSGDGDMRLHAVDVSCDVSPGTGSVVESTSVLHISTGADLTSTIGC